ncbi:MAG: N-acetylmuramoyl-L-alanine amidase, partial [Thermacetogeniaceae bacterium]
MKKTLNIFFVVLLTTLCIFYTNLISIAYAQETKLTPIMGESQATQEQAIQILKERNRIDNNDPKSDQYIEDFVNTTWEEAATEGVRADIAFSLMMLETNFLKSEYVDQNNFGGLGVYEGGAPASFDNVRLGIRAVVQHIKAYASTAHLVNECIDPRFKLITTRGCAEYLEWLGQKENPQGYGWATANGHGYRILNILNQMCGNPLTPFIHELNVTRSGSTYNITTQSTNADGALYKFVAINTTTGQQTVIQNYSQKSTATWTPSNSGSYIIKAYIKRPSSPYEYDAFTTCNVTVQNWVQTTIKSFTVDKPEVYAGQAFTATVVATSMNKPLYKFWIGEQSSDGKWSWTVIQNYSEKNYVTYTLKKPGIYGLSVYVKDSLSSIDPEVVKKCDVTVIAIATIVLDAGHGGSDPGAVSSANTGSLKESDLNLQQTLILGNILESNGFNVIYTRDNKTSNPTLSERATLANDINADLFISIHHDSSTSKSAHGISTHYSTYRPLLDNEGLYVE